VRHGFIPPHGGYENLASYQKALIIFQATYYLAAKWVRMGSRTRDQMEQSARSGKQNIVEGSLASATSKQTEVHLTNVAKASLGELLEDYKDFLRLRGLPVWTKDDPRALEMRALAKLDDGTGATFETYRRHVESENPEIVGNVMVCLCNQACFLLKQQIREQEREFLEQGGIRERMTKARIEARAAPNPRPPACPLCGKPMRNRVARQGPKNGQAFWGCSAYPDCRGTRPMDDAASPPVPPVPPVPHIEAPESGANQSRTVREGRARYRIRSRTKTGRKA
jgi:four helix bundle suffix protein